MMGSRTGSYMNELSQNRLAVSSLTAHVLSQAEQHPNRAAIIYPEGVMSYSQLILNAQTLASHLYKLGVQPEEPVGILFGSGVEHIVCQLAVLLAGGTCLPLSPELPDARINMMLDETQARLTVTTASSTERSLNTQFIVYDSTLIAANTRLKWLDNNIGLSHRSHILFTSGTTGRPKGVEIEARGIIRMFVDATYLQVDYTDRIACHANPAFDGSFLEVWAGLLNGATLVIIPKETLLNPTQFEQVLQEQAITYLFMTTSLFNFMAPQCPRAFRSLNTLLIGGEAFNVHALKSLEPDAWPKNILNCYGPTEGTTVTLYHSIIASDLSADALPIGKPIDKTQIFILDEQLMPVPVGDTGQIYIGGEGLARGYINQPALTDEKFKLIDVHSHGPAKYLYSTGDLGRQRSDGAVMYLGRIDNQIKIQGYRIEVEEVEQHLLGSGFLQAAVVCLIKKALGESYLLAFVVPKNPDSFNSISLHGWMNQHLPLYMVPRIQVIDQVPLNENGKADRSTLLATAEKLQTSSELKIGAGDDASDILAIWQEVLDVPKPTMDDEFFLLGGTSLQAARLILEIKRRFGQRLLIQDVYDAQTPCGLLNLLKHPKQEIKHDICNALLVDSHLPDDIQPLVDSPDPWLAPSAGRALLFGATGFMGGYCLRDLLKHPNVRQVVCVVRAKTDELAHQRVIENLEQYGLWHSDFAQRLLVLAGDISRPQFGLDASNYQYLANKCDVIFHAAAHISFIEPYENHRDVNIVGLINILRLAVDAKAKPLHYVSTIATMGPAGLLFPVERFYEDDDLLPYLDGLKYTLGYIQSKWVAERLLSQARERGIPLSVYRPGFMMTDSLSGAGNAEDFMWRIIKGCIATGAFPLLHGDRKELIPVDYASAAMINLASDNKRLNNTYHLIPPSDEESISFIEFFELFDQCGYSLQPLPYKQWLQRLYEDPALDDNPLMPLLPMLSEVVYEGLTLWEVFQNIPRYDAQKTQMILTEAGGPQYTPTTAALLSRYLSFMEGK